MRSLRACTKKIFSDRLRAPCCVFLLTNDTHIESELKYTNKIYKIYEVRVVFQPLETLYFVLTKKFGASCAGMPGSGCRLGYFSLYPTDNTKMLSLISSWSKAHNLDNLHPELNPYLPTNQLTNQPTNQLTNFTRRSPSYATSLV